MFAFRWPKKRWHASGYLLPQHDGTDAEKGMSMSDKPTDPAQDTIDQHERHSETFEGQQGYGVDYQDERFQNEELQEMPEGGRAGSYEQTNTGGYGKQLPPDPEAQQGQGGE